MDVSQLAELTPQTNMYVQILVLLGTSTLVVTLLSRLRLSPIMGYMLAGLLIGPGVLGWIKDVGALHSVADLGITCLLFIIGLEMSLSRLAALRQIMLGFGALQVVLSAIALAGIMIWLGLAPFPAFIIGTALALSSTAVVVQLLSDRNELGTRLGRTAFATLLLQDLVAIPLIGMAAMGTPPESALDIVAAAAKATFALAVILVLGGALWQPLLRRVARTRNMEVFTAFTLFVVIGMGVATQAAGLSMALGAFLAGLLLSGTEYRHKVEADIAPFKGLLLGLFFMTVGMTIDVKALAGNASTIVLGILALTLIKGAVIYAAARATGKPAALALRLVFYLAGAGEFAFVVIGAVHAIGLIDSSISQQLLAITSGSLLLTPLLAEIDRVVQRRAIPLPPSNLRAPPEIFGEVVPQIILCGFGRMGEVVANELQAQQVKFIAVDNDADRVVKGQQRGIPVYFGRADDMAMLRQLGIDHAHAVIVTLDRRQMITDTVSIINEAWPHISLLARAHDHDHAAELQQLGVNVTVVETVAASLSLVEAALVLAEASAEINAITGERPVL